MTKKKSIASRLGPSRPKAKSKLPPKIGIKKDELDRTVGIAFHFQGFELGLKTTSRAVAALDRLFGGVIGLPAAYAEGFRAKAEAKFRKFDVAEYSELPPNVIRRIVAEELRTQENLEAVWAAAKEYLLDQSAADPGPEEEGPDEISPDWMNHFASFAEKASSETVRLLWGRILAGEIKHPASFSLTALRIVSEVDAEIAEAFQDIAQFRMVGIPFGFSEDLIGTPAGIQGQMLVSLSVLEEAGLILGASSPLVTKFKINKGSPATIVLTSQFGILVETEELEKSVRINFIKITRAGSQVCTILPWDQFEACKKIGQLIEGAVKVTVVEILKRLGNDVTWRKVVVVKDYSSD